VEQDAGSDVLADAGAGVIFDLGQPCADGCSTDSCYVPGTGEGAICSLPCSIDADCGASGICQVLGGSEGMCFLRCLTDNDCTQANPQSQNPLVCLASYNTTDPYLGDQSSGTQCRSLCAQISEP